MQPYIINVLLGISALTSAVLSTLMIVKSKQQGSFFLSLSTYGATLWIISEIVFLNFENVYWTTLSAKFLHIAGSVILSAFVFFSYTFLGPNILTNKKLLVTVLFIFFLAVFGLLFTNTIIGPTAPNENHSITFGPLYPFYAFYIIAAAFFSFYYLGKKSIAAKDRLKKAQLIYIGAGTICSLSFGLVLNIIFPFFEYFTYYWFGPFLTIVFVTFASYAILKHHLFNIKVISTELFSAIIVILVLVDALLAKTRTELILKFGLLAGVIVISLLIIQSVFREIKAKEEIAKISAELQKANKELRRLDQEKSDFLNIATHQLRTPMTIIKGYMSMIKEGIFGKISSEAEDAVNKVYVSNERLIKLINDLLDISRIERGKMKYNFKKQNIEKVVENTCAEFNLVAKNKGLKLEYFEPKSEIPEITFDEDYLRQVLANLLDNAIKYTKQGEITISLSHTNDKITIKVQDTGQGLTQKEIGQLFKRYHRGIQEGIKGLGIGLYVAKKVVDDHKGKIWAQSAGEGKGSTFLVELAAK